MLKIRWLRVAGALLVAIAVVAYGLWHFVMRRSETIRLHDAGYDLTYTMAWGTGMEQQVRFSRVGWLLPGVASEWVKLWDKPYNSGLSVYRAKDGSRYYLGSVYRVFSFDIASGVLSSSCNPAASPPLTDLGRQLEFYNNRAVLESLDPGGRSLFGYIEADQTAGPMPDEPPSSRYFEGLEYLGRFGLVRSSGRGNEVRFVPAGNVAEPRNSLLTSCG